MARRGKLRRPAVRGKSGEVGYGVELWLWARLTSSTSFARLHGVVPFAVECGGADPQGRHLLVRDLDARWVAVGVQGRPDRQPLGRGRRCDHVDDHLMADQRLAPPVVRYVAEQPMLHLVPLA